MTLWGGSHCQSDSARPQPRARLRVPLRNILRDRQVSRWWAIHVGGRGRRRDDQRLHSSLTSGGAAGTAIAGCVKGAF